jgi:anti-sigma regulatory factor (Ser/Thr protein kinase)/predicted ArsR family transcriptional regulator
MDWYLDAVGDRAAQVSALRREIAGFLERHAEPGSDVSDAELIVSELLTNAVRHADGPAWVSIDWSDLEPIVIVRDLGPGFAFPDTAELPSVQDTDGRGLFIASQLAPSLQRREERSVGSDVRATLPLRRPAEQSLDPPHRTSGSLPDPSEMSAEGTFGRESFLRALVVQLARSVEDDHGPATAEAAVAQVGTDVGSRMEEAYRATRSLEGRLTQEQMADLYVRLKGAIGGRFRVAEMDDDRIVLVTDACPFGEVVRRSPSLCRMTSSVFGGIAARNAGGAAVQLEERIAVGDPGCRVVVWLADPPPGAREVSHFYGERDAVGAG